MLGQIEIERRAQLDRSRVMLDDFLQRPQGAIMRVRRCEFHVSQRRHGEFALVPFLSCH